MKKIPYMKIERITPARAAKMLELNNHNRHLRQALVDHYANAMKRGEWRWDNGEAIKVDTHGNLLDGQHRLWAVLQADVPTKMEVTYDVAPDSFKTIDQGRSRSIADVFRIEGESNTLFLSATLSLVWKYQDGTLRRGGRATHSQLKEVLNEHPNVKQSVACVSKFKLPRGFVPRASLALVHYGISRTSIEGANQFVDHVCVEGGLERGHPVILLRKRLLANRESRSKMSWLEQLALIIKAWNAVVGKRRIKTLRWAVTEPFPDIAGW